MADFCCAPFVVLTTLLEQQRFAWCCVDIALCFRLFFCFWPLPIPTSWRQTCWIFGAVGLLTGLRTTGIEGETPYNFTTIWFRCWPRYPMCCTVPGCLPISRLKFHGKGHSGLPAGAGGNALYQDKPARLLWLTFGLPAAAWLLPTLFAWFKCFSIL